MRPTARLLLMMLCLTSLAGCSWMRVVKDECLEPQPWEKAVGIAPLHAADGLPAPSGKAALKIPDGEALTPRGTAWKPRCLDAPPKFDSGQKAVPTARPAESKGSAGDAASAVPAGGTR